MVRPRGVANTAPVNDAEPPEPKKRKHTKRNVFLGAAAVVVLIIAVSAAVAGGDNGGKSTTANNQLSPSASQWLEAKQQQEIDASAAAEQSSIAAAAAAASASQEAAQQATEKDPSQYQQITDRDWSLIAKNPDAHAGEKVVVYGKVTQSDAAMGDNEMRVDVGGEQQDEGYEYDTNTVVEAGIPGIFGQVVEGDMVTMYARVDGSMSYDTQIGGSTTVPQLDVYVITVTGHED